MSKRLVGLAVPLLLSLALAAGCAVEKLELRADAPDPPPLPAELAARFAFEPAPLEPRLEPVEEGVAWRKFRGTYPTRFEGDTADRTVTFELWRSTLGAGPRPLVVIVPILAGRYPECDHLGRLMARSGMHAFFVHREDNLLAFGKGADAGAAAGQVVAEPFERKLRRSIVNIRRTLDWACAQPEVDRSKVGLVGISLGAIAGSIAMAVEPRIRAGVLIMGGGDLPGIVCDSIETPVRRYKIHRMRDDGLSEAEFKADVRRQLPSDPLDFAPFVGARRVQQYVALYDNKVPTAYQWKLWEALGRPECFAVPIGHYTAIFYLGMAERNAMAFMKKRLDYEGPAAAPRSLAALDTRAPRE